MSATPFIVGGLWHVYGTDGKSLVAVVEVLTDTGIPKWLATASKAAKTETATASLLPDQYELGKLRERWVLYTGKGTVDFAFTGDYAALGSVTMSTFPRRMPWTKGLSSTTLDSLTFVWKGNAPPYGQSLRQAAKDARGNGALTDIQYTTADGTVEAATTTPTWSPATEALPARQWKETIRQNNVIIGYLYAETQQGSSAYRQTQVHEVVYRETDKTIQTVVKGGGPAGSDRAAWYGTAYSMLDQAYPDKLVFLTANVFGSPL